MGGRPPADRIRSRHLSIAAASANAAAAKSLIDYLQSPEAKAVIVAKGMTAGTHGSTYGGNPLGMAVGSEAVGMILEDGFLTRVNDAAKPLVAVDLKTPDAKPVVLLVEGPSPEWALPIPKPAQGAPAGRQHFGFELDGLPPGVSPKGQFELTFTLVSGDRAVEVKTHLD